MKNWVEQVFNTSETANINMACFQFCNDSWVKYHYPNYMGWNVENFNSNSQPMKETDHNTSNPLGCHMINKPGFHQLLNYCVVKIGWKTAKIDEVLQPVSFVDPITLQWMWKCWTLYESLIFFFIIFLFSM